ncbi:SDR family NAD(P)-dependent oxidoreductase [Paenibacillus sp. UMB4589-SE434]|uniref:SDR family NAD(P)-dependent oxidoreductase n=1 Tax=Paenibacillus sp. UMB4589-SE434 TaxID=3046314 RepID=UPI00254DE726|nr:SDR family NAD(P)-dependent oxidoreductase [Paenibacillus sp. UMB4589-SE434]MDK8180307.1 SDR family NAD(P)-dependent oxidoreductase [Paenibacillus sp. UMB4589-SE434]
MTMTPKQDIAIIGIAGRFPGAASVQEFWENLQSGINSITLIPNERWNWQDVYGDPQKEKNKTNSKWGGFIADINKFDPLFFGISPKEANYIDPQHRIFLETVWQVIENAGYRANSLSGKKVGVYAGVSKNDYAELLNTEDISAFVSTGTVHSILANRVSHFFNFRGPSEAIDTACSSSLVALHHACRDIREGECEAAIVGGVNALLSPRMYISHAKSGMLSADGQCKTFDTSADGYVRGEGVAAMFLKPLTQARKDRDNVLGIIKSSAINHGGRSNFLTAPSVDAQSEVVYSALRHANVDPRNISYIEAHGTGTPLGDPIEINALKKAYTQYFEEKGFEPDENSCGLGSVKTYIGHLESAAGMASIFKVLLAMQHGLLPGLFNHKETNPYISLVQSPFFLVTAPTTWKRRRINGKTLSRQAGVSGFGMGGVNAHVILEEPSPPLKQRRKGTSRERMILLSAKKGRLQATVQQLVTFLRSKAGQAVSLDDLAFTLMFGRDEFEERLAVIAESTTQVLNELERFLRGDTTGCVHGIAVVKKDKALIVPNKTDSPSMLAEQWVRGEPLAWAEEIYDGRRIVLPGYLFERIPCWFEQKSVAPADSDSVKTRAVDEEPSFGSSVVTSVYPVAPIRLTISNRDPLVQDHLVHGQKVMPGVGYLDLIARTLEQKAGAVWTFADIYWLKPLVLEKESRNVELTVEARGNGEFVQFHTGNDQNCQGMMLAGNADMTDKRIDLQAIRERCVTELVQDELYDLFFEHGLGYGDSFRVIGKLRYSRGEALAEIVTSSSERIRAGLLDGALQAAVGLSVSNQTASQAQYVPYFAETFQFYSTLETVRFYYVKQHEGNKKGSLRFDLYYCDEQGHVLGIVKNFTKRPLTSIQTQKILEIPTVQPMLFYTSDWRQEVCAPEVEVKGLLLVNGSEQLEEQMLTELADKVPFLHLKIKPHDHEACLEAFLALKESGFPLRQMIVPAESPGAEDLKMLLLLAQVVIKSKFKQAIKMVYASELVREKQLPALLSAGGFARTLKYEYPRLRLEIVTFDQSFNSCGHALLEELFTSSEAPLHEVKYESGLRHARIMSAIQGDSMPEKTLLKRGGVYLIAGGAGGLGRIFSSYLAETQQASIVLLGRRPLTEQIKAQLAQLERLGSTGEYIPVDLGNEAQVTETVQMIRLKYGKIDGVLHGGGMIDDGFILRKTADSFENVVRPKLAGTIHLDRATAGDELDFFVMFSSIAALMPNQGQGDYASGNSFMDGYANYRRQLVASRQRSGLTISINWPLWANGGMQVEPEEREHLWNVFGMQPLAASRGLQLFEEALGLARRKGYSHIVGIEGDQIKINRHFGIFQDNKTEQKLDFTHLVTRDLFTILAQVLHLPFDEIGAKQPLHELGVDSMSLLTISKLITESLGVDFKPTLLFEYGTPQQIVDFLLQDKHRATIAEQYGKLGALAPLYRSTGLIDLHTVQRDRSLFQRRYDNTEFYQLDHVVDNKYNVPGACYAEMARQAGALLLPTKKVNKLLNCYWAKQLSSAGEPFDVYIQLMQKGSRTTYEIYSMEQSESVVHATGELQYAEFDSSAVNNEFLDLIAIRQRCTTSWTREQVYQQIHAEGLIVGESFMPMQEIVLSESEALSTLKLPENIDGTYDDYLLHPTMLTGVFQTALINNRYHGDDDRDFIPVGIDCVEMIGIIPRQCHVYCEMNLKTKDNPDIKKFNLKVCGEDGVVAARLTNFSIKVVKYDKSAAQQTDERILDELRVGKDMQDGLAIKSGQGKGNMKESELPIDGQIGAEMLKEHAAQFLRKLVADSIGLEETMIVPDEPFESYGINSILILELNKQLEDAFDAGLSKTLFFEYRNLAELIDYFVDEHADMLRDKLLIPTETPSDLIAPPESSPEISNLVVDVCDNPLAEGEVISQVTIKPEALAVAHAERHAPASRDIAIIGLAGRYPQAESLAEFWDNLRSGRDCTEEIPLDRFDRSHYYNPDKQHGKLYSKWGSFLQDVDEFDPMFFNIPPREAELMDPQERLFLEVVWHALEDAGYTRQSLSDDTVGVFVGAMWQPYQELAAIAQSHGEHVSPSGYLYSIANRVSYFCNFNGPSLTVDTACSASLTALHLACQSLITDESSIAIAGGVNVSIGAGKYLFLSQYRFLSTDGKCRSFGADGDGYVPGEGVGAVLLKRLENAIKDGDHIYGVIKATAVNHGGKTNGYTVPNPTEQAGVILKTLERSNMDPRKISYIEAHGTGTALGDPIEISGLTHAFAKYTKDKQFCAIGSLKSNIGHLEASAGIAGLTKVLLQLKHKQIAPSLHSDPLNPNIDFANTPFIVSRELSDWKRPDIKIDGEIKQIPRIAGISSFGAGGANAHAIVCEYMAEDTKPKLDIMGTSFIFLLSAKHTDRLQMQAKQLVEAIYSGLYTDADLPAISFTLLTGREPMEERLALLAGSLQELTSKLQDFLTGSKGGSVYRGQAKEYKEALSLLTHDEDMQIVIKSWSAKKKYDKLLGLWVKGMSIDWRFLFMNYQPRRISLPGYPFAKERYRFPTECGSLPQQPLYGASPNTINELALHQSDPMRQKVFVTKEWELCEIRSPRRAHGMVAILATPELRALSAELANLLPHSRLFDVRHVSEEFDWSAFDGLIDLAGCTQDCHDSSDWMRWLQLLIDQKHREGLMLLGVTQDLERFGDHDEVNLTGAMRAGLYRMLQCEYSHLRSRHLDIEGSSDETTLARLIVQEYLADSGEMEICYRNSRRYRPVLREREKGGLQGERLSFPEHHVLWITGGTRGIGLLCAQHFVKHYGVKRLVLTGRESLPPREQWNMYTEQHTSAARKIRAILALEEDGAAVEVLSVPLSDARALAQSLQQIHQRFGPVGGVLHCAGSLDKDNPAFIRKTMNGINQVLEPKITGINHLISCFREEPLQFFVAFSSVSALLPSLAAGLSDYAVGNTYMDYVAAARSKELPIVSLQWPSWQETGMGEIRNKAYDLTGLVPITNQEGLEFLDYVLAKKIGPVLMPAIVNPAVWKPTTLLQLDRADRGRPAAKLCSPPEIKAVSGRGQANTRTIMENLSWKQGIGNGEGRSAEIWLVGLFAKELKMDPSLLDTDTEIHEYGIDSIIQAQLLQKIGQTLEQQLDPSLLMEYHTIRALASYLERSYKDALNAVLITLHNDASMPAKMAQALETAGQFLQSDAACEHGQAVSWIQDKQAHRSSDIAVVGMSCRLPGADSPEQYWKLLTEGRSVIRQVPYSRWEYSTNYYAGLLDDITKFDTSFFRISEQDAKVMDPQALLLLEEALKLWHQAGYDYEEVKGRAIGVYLGARSNYMQSELDLLSAANPILAVGQNYLAANISQFFDLRGPSAVVDTACSSALVAMNMAVQALQGGDIEAAVVGGANLLSTDATHRMFKLRGILNEQPQFHLFDNRASGVIPGEGAGLVLLKTVEQALRDGDRIYGVIKGIAINNNGRTAGISIPNLEGQQHVLEAALTKSGLRPEQVSYIETNGSGTIATDILELKTIYSAYRSDSSAPLGLGSMKPNIGHPLFAEGIAGFIKVVLMLHHRQHVPFLSGEGTLTHFDLSGSPFKFCRDTAPWNMEARIAAVNCFGDGGTNAHVIIGDLEEALQRMNIRSPKPLPLLQPKDIRCQNSARSVWSGGNVWRQM